MSKWTFCAKPPEGAGTLDLKSVLLQKLISRWHPGVGTFEYYSCPANNGIFNAYMLHVP